MPHRFDLQILHEIAKKGIGLPHEQMFPAITDALSAAYPGHIHRDMDWIYSNAGGTMGVMKPLYFSATEYLMFFGTPIGTEGHSGRHRAEIYEFILEGEMWAFTEGDTERRVRGPGDMTRLRAHESFGYRIPDHAWMLEYGRGPIFTMSPFFLASAILITQDTRSLWRMTSSFGRLFLRDLLNKS
jgi:C-8 sterol isomerase